MDNLKVMEESIFLTLSQSLENKSKEDIFKELNGIFQNIDSILNNLNQEYAQRITQEFFTNTISELRTKTIEESQKLSYCIDTFGLKNIELFDGDFFKRLVYYNYAIEMCEEKLNTKKENQENKIIYFFTKSSLKDLSKLPSEYYFIIKDTTDRMLSGNYKGRNNRWKVLKHDRKLENTIEHRGNCGIRIYENKVNENIHFVYRIERKKCDSANGLNEIRIQRYQNEKENVQKRLDEIGKQEFIIEAEESTKEAYEILQNGLKEINPEKELQTIGLSLINDYLHTSYDVQIFDGLKDENISFDEIEDDQERYRVYSRVINYLSEKSYEELKPLTTLFYQLKDLEDKNTIISYLAYLLKDDNLEDLLNKEKEILLLIDFKEKNLTGGRDDKHEIPIRR